jgi:pimeloyl-ACP methyl ester carboxylesterase
VAHHHHWFRSGIYSLLTHLDLPEKQSARSGVVIVPPFGWEDICSYRPLRSLARGLASQGIPALRFDLPGTGDSSGSALDPELFSAWIRSVQGAVAELQAVSGVQSVSLLGIRLGAMLALAAASPGTAVKNLILWGASATGHSLLRELRAFRNLEVAEYAEGEAPPPQPVAGLEVAGFLLNRGTESSLDSFSALDFAPSPDQRILLLSRDNFPHDNKLVQFLQQAGCPVTLKAGMGFQKMMAQPHEPLPFSPETEKIIVDFLQTEMESKQTISLPTLEKVRQTGSDRLEEETGSRRLEEGNGSCRLDEDIRETICSHPYRGRSLFSILATPAAGAPSSEWGLLFLNAGGVRHIGPNRMWVEASRRWAASGIPSIRLDFFRVGESDGDQLANIANLHDDDLVEQISIVMKEMQLQLNCRQFIAVGLCSGAYAAFQVLIRDPAIRGAVLLNPRLFFWDPSVEARRLAKRVGTGLSDVSDWRRLARGEIKPERVKQAARVALKRFFRTGSAIGGARQIPAEALAQAWRQVKRFRTQVTLVFAEGEPLFEEMEDEKQLPPLTDPLIRCIGVGKVGHTFRALWAQQMLHDLIDREINLMMGEKGILDISQRLPERLSLT